MSTSGDGTRVGLNPDATKRSNADRPNVERLQRRLNELQNRRDLTKKDVVNARKSLRRRENTAKRQRAVVGRFSVILRICWSFLYLGVATLGGGVVTTYADAVTPLRLGGPIVACFITGGVVTIAAIIALGTIYDGDHNYVSVQFDNNKSKSMTRAEYADHAQHIAEEKLDDLTELTIELQELDVHLCTVEAKLAELT